MDSLELEQKIKEELAINDQDLVSEARTQPSRFHYWGALAAKAAAKSRASKAFLDSTKAERGKSFREQMSEADSKVRVTERMLDDFLDTDEKVRAALQGYIEAQYVEDMLGTAVEAFRERHYAIIELMKHRESERIMHNEYEQMRKDFEAREASKRR